MAQVIIEKLSDFIRAQTLRFKRNEFLPQNPSDTSKKHFVINDIKAANRYLIQQFDRIAVFESNLISPSKYHHRQ